MDVCEASRRDLPELVDELWFPFAKELARIDSFDELDEGIRDDALQYRNRLLERDDVGMWIARDGEEYAGLAMVEHRRSPPVFRRGDAAHLHELYVVPAIRGEGLGTHLLSRVERWANERGCKHVSLEVNADNSFARDYYRRQGFEVKRETMIAPL